MTNGSGMDKNGYETINVRPATKTRLIKRKIHPGQSFDEVLNLLMDATEKPKRVPGPRSAMEAEAW